MAPRACTTWARVGMKAPGQALATSAFSPCPARPWTAGAGSSPGRAGGLPPRTIRCCYSNAAMPTARPSFISVKESSTPRHTMPWRGNGSSCGGRPRKPEKSFSGAFEGMHGLHIEAIRLSAGRALHRNRRDRRQPQSTARHAVSPDRRRHRRRARRDQAATLQSRARDRHAGACRRLPEKGRRRREPVADGAPVGIARRLADPGIRLLPATRRRLSVHGFRPRQRGLPGLSTGASYLGEVASAIDWLAGAGPRELALMHCLSEYPAPVEQANLRAMASMRAAFKVPVGYSDHTPGQVAAVVAVGLGAAMIEKHYTLDKNLPGPDHQASLDIPELRAFVTAVRQASASLGDGIKRPAPAEIDNRPLIRKSVVCAVPAPPRAPGRRRGGGGQRRAAAGKNHPPPAAPKRGAPRGARHGARHGGHRS